MLVSVFYQIIEKLFLTSQSIPDSDTIPSGHVQLLHMVPGKIQLASGGVHSVFFVRKDGQRTNAHNLSVFPPFYARFSRNPDGVDTIF
jgi:hypothetical protein